MKKNKGTTLIELMVTITIATILISIAIPSFRDLIIRNRLSAATNDLVAGINYARAEAIKRGISMTLCKSSSGTACDGAEWENGWIAFTDLNADGDLDTGENILRVWSSLPTDYTLRPNNNFVNFIRYNALGEANNIGTFAVCHDNESAKAKAIVVTRLRPRLGLDTNGNGIPEADSGDIDSCTSP
jgi:type IV fimbrial biogenesis protein FimT